MDTNKKTTTEAIEALITLVEKHRAELSKTQEMAEQLLGDIEEALYAIENAGTELTDCQSAMQEAAKNATHALKSANDYLRRTV